MALTDEHWDLIIGRGLAVAMRRAAKERKASCDEADAAYNELVAAYRAARDAAETDPSDEKKRQALIDAQKAAQLAKIDCDTARKHLHALGQENGKLDCLRDCWEVFSDGDNLEAWLEAEEVKASDEDLAEAQAALDKAKADLAERKAAKRG